MRLMPFILFPAVALVAQAPSPHLDLAQRFNTELPGINQMLRDLKFEEALTRIQSLIPAEHPIFDASSPKAIGESLDNAQGLMSLYRLWANVASENGQWEKALEIHEHRAQAARGILADLDKAQSPLLAQWKKVAQDSGNYVTTHEPRKRELDPKVKAFTAEHDALQAAVKAGKNKPSKKELDDFNARAVQNQQDEQELAQINAALPVHKQNVANAPRVFKMLGDNQKEVAGMVSSADEAIAKAKEALANQNKEISEFTTQQVIRRVKVVGKKTWVDAVLRAPENITKLGTPQAQAAFLNRMLVLDPGNAGATKALANLKQGKAPFAKEPKHSKKATSRRKK